MSISLTLPIRPVLLAALIASAHISPARAVAETMPAVAIRRLPPIDLHDNSTWEIQLATVERPTPGPDLDQRLDTFETRLRNLEAERAVASASPPADLKFGYDNGFTFVSPEGLAVRPGNAPFSMRFNSWIQLRHTLRDSQGSNLDENDLEFERLRLTLTGHVHTPNLEYFIQVDGDSDQSETLDLLDFVFTYDFGEEVLEREDGRIGFKAGKWKIPYNRARRESLWKMQFSDLTLASGFFDVNRSLGIALYGRLDAFCRPVFWEAGVFNGLNTGGFRPGRRAELDRNFAYAARAFTDVCGEWSNDGEPDLSFHLQPAVRIGAGMAFTHLESEGAREFSRFPVVDSGDTLASVLPAAVTAYDFFLVALDANFKFRGLSLLSEIHFRSVENFSGAAVPDLFDHGYYLQVGYFLVPEKLELLARWSRVAGDSGTLGSSAQSADELAGGVTWYLRGHNAKVTFDVTHLNGAPVSDTVLNILPGDAGWLYRTQLQLRL